ncbi:unnamed protein product, partial [Allacma fusca]
RCKRLDIVKVLWTSSETFGVYGVLRGEPELHEIFRFVPLFSEEEVNRIRASVSDEEWSDEEEEWFDDMDFEF